MKLMLKLTFKTIGLIITLLVLFAAFTVITERANDKYTNSGSYNSDLLTWEQEHPGEGTLMVLGNPVTLNLDSLANIKSNIESGTVKLISFLPETASITVHKILSAVTSVAEAIWQFIF